jgi:hypothetical protein
MCEKIPVSSYGRLGAALVFVSGEKTQDGAFLQALGPRRPSLSRAD